MNRDVNGRADAPTRLSRKLSTFDAVIMGLGAMIGAGIFAVVGPAAQIAGSGLLPALLLAAVLAYCNATSSAQLAALYPESGGAYVYGRKRLGNFWGFLAGWGFIVGKTASCAAMALTFAGYAVPAMMRPLAVFAVLALTAVNYFGVKKTALLTRLIVSLVLVSLATVIVAVLFGGQIDARRLLPDESWGLYPILQAAGLWFFAFAGYARLATLGEEVEEPRRTIPRAIPMALGITLLLYLCIAIASITAVDIDILADAKAPLAAAVEAGSLSGLSIAVRIGAAIASLGVLLSLIAGVSRTSFAMAANRDLPRFLEAVHPRHKVPHHAELLVGVLVALVVSLADVRSAIGFSSFTVLTYYAITNASAFRLSSSERLWPRWLSAAGMVGCIVLAFCLPLSSVLGGVVTLLLGAGWFAVRPTLMNLKNSK